MSLDEFLIEANDLTKDVQFWNDLEGVTEDATSEAWLSTSKMLRLWVAMYGTAE